MQTTHYKTATIAAITTLIGAILITIATPIFYQYPSERLFHQLQIYIFSLIPIFLFYNIYQYVIFPGKITGGSYGE